MLDFDKRLEQLIDDVTAFINKNKLTQPAEIRDDFMDSARHLLAKLSEASAAMHTFKAAAERQNPKLDFSKLQ